MKVIMRSRMRESRTYGSVRGQCREALVYSTVSLLQSRHKAMDNSIRYFIHRLREYFNEYPTIFYLREELLKNEKTHDVRLVFLAILNLFKHCGNFLNESMSGEAKEVLSFCIYWRKNTPSYCFSKMAWPYIFLNISVIKHQMVN